MNELAPGKVVVMNCDAPGCLRQPKRGPRLVIPSRTPWEVDHRPLKIMTTVHYCDEHRDAFDPAAYLTDAKKAEVEKIARMVRPVGFRPDFERATCEQLLITTPEYKRFMRLAFGGLHVIA